MRALILVALVLVRSVATAETSSISGEVVPQGCYTSYTDDSFCWEPSDPNVLWAYFEDDPSSTLEYYGPVVGTLVNRYVHQYQKLLYWKEKALKRGARMSWMRRRIRELSNK